MSVIIGLIVGLILGFCFIKKQMDQRLYMILKKSGMTDQQVDGFMAYYRNYSKIQKEADKLMRDNALKMEADYRLRKTVSSEETEDKK